MKDTMFLKQARTALERAEATMAASALDNFEARQIMADCRMLLKALDPDYFDSPGERLPLAPELPDSEFNFPFDEEVA